MTALVTVPLSPEQMLLSKYYKKGAGRIKELVDELIAEHIEEFDELCEEEQDEIRNKAFQDILANNVELASFMSYMNQKSREEAIKSLGFNDQTQLDPEEARAIVDEQQLRILQATGLEINLVTGNLLEEIEITQSFAAHPNDYTKLSHMAEAAGISVSECSDLKAIAGTIFPYIENVLKLNARELWIKIGKARFRRITPILRTLMDPGRDGTDRVQKQIERLQEHIAEDMLVNKEDVGTIDLLTHLLALAEMHTLRNLDDIMRPEKITPFELMADIEAAPSMDVYIRGTISLGDLDTMKRLLGAHVIFSINHLSAIPF